MKFARIVSNKAVDTRTESSEGYFTPEIAAEFVEVPDEVEDGWSFDNGQWSAPEIPVIPEPESVVPVVVYPTVSPVEFQLLFTSAERIAMRNSDDPTVQDFVMITSDPRLTSVNLNLKSTQVALEYLTTVGILAYGRKEEILSGEVI